MNPLIRFAIEALIASGALAAAGHWVASKLPPVHAHTPSAKLNAILDTLGNACENIIKAELNGDLLTQVAQAVVAGKPVAGPLAASLPGLKAMVLEQVGPAVQAALAEALGSSDAADKRLTTEVLVAAHSHALESAKVMFPAPSGRTIVAPAP